jgi:hypothetical protein
VVVESAPMNGGGVAGFPVAEGPVGVPIGPAPAPGCPCSLGNGPLLGHPPAIMPVPGSAGPFVPPAAPIPESPFPAAPAPLVPVPVPPAPGTTAPPLLPVPTPNGAGQASPTPAGPSSRRG